MQKPSYWVFIADLLIIFLFGAGLCFTHLFIFPMSALQHFVITGALGFFLGTLAPQADELVEWLLFFSLGILLVALWPQITQYFNSGVYDLKAMSLTTQQTLPYILQCLSPWTLALPLGLFFHKVTHRNYYRHARFF